MSVVIYLESSQNVNFYTQFSVYDKRGNKQIGYFCVKQGGTLINTVRTRNGLAWVSDSLSYSDVHYIKLERPPSVYNFTVAVTTKENLSSDLFTYSVTSSMDRIPLHTSNCHEFKYKRMLLPNGSDYRTILDGAFVNGLKETTVTNIQTINKQITFTVSSHSFAVDDIIKIKSGIGVSYDTGLDIDSEYKIISTTPTTLVCSCRFNSNLIYNGSGTVSVVLAPFNMTKPFTDKNNGVTSGSFYNRYFSVYKSQNEPSKGYRYFRFLNYNNNDYSKAWIDAAINLTDSNNPLPNESGGDTVYANASYSAYHVDFLNEENYLVSDGYSIIFLTKGVFLYLGTTVGNMYPDGYNLVKVSSGHTGNDTYRSTSSTNTTAGFYDVLKSRTYMTSTGTLTQNALRLITNNQYTYSTFAPNISNSTTNTKTPLTRLMFYDDTQAYHGVLKGCYFKRYGMVAGTEVDRLGVKWWTYQITNSGRPYNTGTNIFITMPLPEFESEYFL